MQFSCLISSDMPLLVWRGCAPPKIKFLAWLILQDSVWTADRLQRWGRPNYGTCKLCNQEPETAAHLLFKCRFTARVWSLLKGWLDLHHIFPRTWTAWDSVKDWWIGFLDMYGTQRMAMGSLIMLTSWNIWTERNARVCRNEYASPSSIMAKIKVEAKNWGLVGAKHLSAIMSGE